MSSVDRGSENEKNKREILTPIAGIGASGDRSFEDSMEIFDETVALWMVRCCSNAFGA